MTNISNDSDEIDSETVEWINYSTNIIQRMDQIIENEPNNDDLICNEHGMPNMICLT